MAGPSRPFQARDLSSEASTPGSATTCRWHARRTGAGTPARNIRSGTLTTGTATADGGALAPCDGSDLLTLRLLSTCSWVIPVCGTAPSLEGWRVVAIPRRSPPRSALCAPRRLLSRALRKVGDLPGRNAADWSCSSSRNPLGNCIGAGPETGPGPDSARPRFLSSRLAAQFLSRRTGLVATPSRGTGETCLPGLAPRRGRTHQLRPPFPRLPGRIPVALSAGFSGRRALDCSIKERDDCPPGPGKSPSVVPPKILTGDGEHSSSRRGPRKLFTGYRPEPPAPARPRSVSRAATCARVTAPVRRSPPSVPDLPTARRDAVVTGGVRPPLPLRCASSRRPLAGGRVRRGSAPRRILHRFRAGARIEIRSVRSCRARRCALAG